MRDVDAIDRELGFLAAARVMMQNVGCRLPIRQVDKLLDERIDVTGLSVAAINVPPHE